MNNVYTITLYLYLYTKIYASASMQGYYILFLYILYIIIEYNYLHAYVNIYTV